MAAKTDIIIGNRSMFLLQIYLIVEFKIPYYSITNLKNSQTYFLKNKKRTKENVFSYNIQLSEQSVHMRY